MYPYPFYSGQLGVIIKILVKRRFGEIKNSIGIFYSINRANICLNVVIEKFRYWNLAAALLCFGVIYAILTINTVKSFIYINEFIRQNVYRCQCDCFPYTQADPKHNFKGKILYTDLLTSGKLNSYLTDVNGQAESLFFCLVKELAEKEGVAEELKAHGQMEWVGRMNNIWAYAEEMVLRDIIYS